jgi:hypothetical protein
MVVDDEHDVRWAEYRSFADVVILDLDDPQACGVLLDGLARTAESPVWVLLLASKNPHWPEVASQKPAGVHVLSLPLTMPRLSAALEELVAGPPLDYRISTDPSVWTGAESEAPSPADHMPREPELSDAALELQHVSPVSEGGTAAAAHLPLHDAVATSLGTPAHGHLNRLPAELADGPLTMEDGSSRSVDPSVVNPASTSSEQPLRSVIVKGETTAEGPSPTDAGTAQQQGGQRRPADTHEETATGTDNDVGSHDPAGVVATPPPPRAISLVRALTGSLPELSSVAETADVVLAEALSLVEADAGAVLVRDGPVWRVAAGHGLRPLEERRSLSSDHWLIERVSDSQCGILLSGGEGTWAELYGAPLSASLFLLAAPLSPAGGMILLLGRNGQEFSTDDLDLAVELGAEAYVLLDNAVDVRRLARLMSRFTDLPD